MKYLKSLLCLMLAIIIVVLSACSSKQIPDANIDPPQEDNQENNEENKTDDQNNGTPSHGDNPNDPGPPSGVDFDSIDGFFAFHDEITTLKEDEIFDFSMSHDMFGSDIDDYCDLTENIVIPFKSSENEELNLTAFGAYRYDSGMIAPSIHTKYRDVDFLYMFEVYKKGDGYILDKYREFKETDSTITREIDGYTFRFRLDIISMGYLLLENHIVQIRVRNFTDTDKEISFEDFDLYTLEELRENFATK